MLETEDNRPRAIQLASYVTMEMFVPLFCYDSGAAEDLRVSNRYGGNSYVRTCY